MFFCVCARPPMRRKSKSGCGSSPVRLLCWGPVPLNRQVQTMSFINKNEENFWPPTLPLTRDWHLILPPAWKQETSWHLAFLPSVLLVLHSFRNIGEPCGFGLPTLFVSPSVFSRVHRAPRLSQSYVFLLINSTALALLEWWLMQLACVMSTWPHKCGAAVPSTVQSLFFIFLFLLFAESLY